MAFQASAQPSEADHRTGLPGGLVDHFDRALRQFPIREQSDVLVALTGRVIDRIVRPGRARFRFRSCHGKRRYETVQAAEAHRRRQGLVKLQAYACSECEGAHLGHRPRRGRA